MLTQQAFYDAKNSTKTYSGKIYHKVQKMIALRKSTPALSRGDLTILKTNYPHVFAYIRSYKGEKYLIDELVKIKRVIDKELPEASREVLMVLDATTGQNAISQVQAFKEAVDITGIVLTKLDGTAKGGAVIGIVNENKVPIKFIGVGEQIDDMEIFNSEDFVKALI